MKNLPTLILTLSFFSTSYSQIVSDSLPIVVNDPRDYITIYESKKSGENKLIWRFSPSAKNQNFMERIPIVDEKSVIKVIFDREAIYSNVDFKGNITIQGEISSSSGANDPVEVLPYTKVGEQIVSIGIPNRPASELSNILINLIIVCADYSEMPTYIDIIQELDNLIKDIKEISVPQDYFYSQNIRDELGLKYRIGFIKGRIDRINEVSRRAGADFFPVALTQAMKESRINFTKDQIIRGLSELKSYFSDNSIRERTIKNTVNEIELVLQYINYFRSGGELAEETFLQIISKDYLQLDAIQQRLIEAKQNLVVLKNDTTYQAQIKIKDEIDRSTELIHKFLEFKGTFIEEFLNNNNELNASNRFGASKLSNDSIIKIIKTNRKFVSDALALEASEILTKNLYTATIDLLKERASEGDFLYLKLVIEEYDKRDDKKTPDRMIKKTFPIGRYEIRRTGWQLDVFDSFILVNRINENRDMSGAVSPSNFKGAPGASLMFTWRKDDRAKQKFWNTVQPSVGLDVSYLDFSTEDDVEIGVGLIFGIFDNNIHGILGINLNSTGPNESSPYYFGVGLSFAKLIDKYLVKK